MVILAYHSRLTHSLAIGEAKRCVHLLGQRRHQLRVRAPDQVDILEAVRVGPRAKVVLVVVELGRTQLGPDGR